MIEKGIIIGSLIAAGSFCIGYLIGRIHLTLKNRREEDT